MSTLILYPVGVKSSTPQGKPSPIAEGKEVRKAWVFLYQP
jgi:hypothetical protein